jgi:hypothetical protein
VLSGFVDQGYRNGGVLGPLTGTAYFVWYLRAIGSKVGKNCALYPGGRMGPMSEPDLVQVGLPRLFLCGGSDVSKNSWGTMFLWTTVLL